MPPRTIVTQDPRIYHVLRALILSSKIFCIFDNSPTVWLFHVIVIAFSLFVIISAIILAKKRDEKLKYRQKSNFLVILWNLFVANLQLFLVTPKTISGVLWDDIAREKVLIWKTLTFEIH